MDSNADSVSKKMVPPYGIAQSFSKFFDLCDRIKIEKIDTQFVRTYDLTPAGVEYKLIKGLKFLGLVNADGTVTEKMKSLGVVGEPFKKNLEIIVKEAYKALFDSIRDLQTAKRTDVINCFRSEYGMAPSMAREGFSIFILLAQKAGINVSADLTSSMSSNEIGRGVKKPPKETKKQIRKEVRQNEQVLDSGSNHAGMIRIEYQNKVLMFLPKGNKQTRQLAAKLARQFLDVYESEEDNDQEEN